VLHNVRYGRLDASDAEVEAVAQKAQVHDAVMRLPQKYATTVGERGLMISGGEKQRLALARVLLKNPEIVCFDEATSALDARTERDVMRSIGEVLKEGKRTSLFVAHRLRTVVDAGTCSSLFWVENQAEGETDIIIVLQDGQVVEQGTHDELLRKDGLYRVMWTQQNVEEMAVPVSDVHPEVGA
jgi:ATP-binding cassette, subfamily B (MDR/TAP), member 7